MRNPRCKRYILSANLLGTRCKRAPEELQQTIEQYDKIPRAYGMTKMEHNGIKLKTLRHNSLHQQKHKSTTHKEII